MWLINITQLLYQSGGLLRSAGLARNDQADCHCEATTNWWMAQQCN